MRWRALEPVTRGALTTFVVTLAVVVAVSHPGVLRGVVAIAVFLLSVALVAAAALMFACWVIQAGRRRRGRERFVGPEGRTHLGRSASPVHRGREPFGPAFEMPGRSRPARRRP